MIPNDDMATLASNPHTPSPPLHRRRKSWARKVERACCLTLSYFPLSFVYGLTTWAVIVEVQVSFVSPISWFSYFKAALGLLLYILANVSYTTAVFTSPGSPTDSRSGRGRRLKGAAYEGLPTYEGEENGNDIPVSEDVASVTIKSTGKQRFCKKCKTMKPDRAHHCSSCKQCVLKMDHHCPWLATCVGLHNYKAFLLFLVYTSVFAATCFAVSINWVWANLMTEIAIEEGWRLVNTIMLSVLGGIIGLVLSCFTCWHLWLTFSGQTTIESLEKTRYLNPSRKSMEHHMQHGRNYLAQGNAEEQQSLTSQLAEIHANALPGVLRAEEGEIERPVSDALPPNPNGSSARQSLQQNYASLEAQREQDRYEAYLDEQDSEKLPNAFDLGWRRNLLHVFGPAPWLWALPVCNTTGDGWRWEVSSDWIAARDETARARAQRQRDDSRWDAHNPATYQSQAGPPQSDLRWQPGQGFVPAPRPPRLQSTQTHLQMQPLDRRKGQAGEEGDAYTTSSDEETHRSIQKDSTTHWNDIPEDLLASRNAATGSRRSRSAARTKGD